MVAKWENFMNPGGVLLALPHLVTILATKFGTKYIKFITSSETTDPGY